MPGGTTPVRMIQRFCVCKTCLFQYLFAVSLTNYSGPLQTVACNLMIEEQWIKKI